MTTYTSQAANKLRTSIASEEPFSSGYVIDALDELAALLRAREEAKPVAWLMVSKEGYRHVGLVKTSQPLIALMGCFVEVTPLFDHPPTYSTEYDTRAACQKALDGQKLETRSVEQWAKDMAPALAGHSADSAEAKDAARWRLLCKHADARDEYEPGPFGTIMCGYAEDEDIFSTSEQLTNAVDAAMSAESLEGSHE